MAYNYRVYIGSTQPNNLTVSQNFITSSNISDVGHQSQHIAYTSTMFPQFCVVRVFVFFLLLRGSVFAIQRTPSNWTWQYPHTSMMCWWSPEHRVDLVMIFRKDVATSPEGSSNLFIAQYQWKSMNIMSKNKSYQYIYGWSFSYLTASKFLQKNHLGEFPLKTLSILLGSTKVRSLPFLWGVQKGENVPCASPKCIMALQTTN